MNLMHTVAKDKNEVTKLGLTLAQVFDVQFFKFNTTNNFWYITR